MKALWTVVLACALAAGPAAQSKAQPKGRTRVAFVGITDSSGPVLTLGPADFDVAESGAKRQVVRASLATTPIGARLAADRRAMSTKYEIEYLTDSADQQPIDVGVAKGGVTIQLSFRRPFR